MDDYGKHPDYYTYRYIHPSGRTTLRLALSNRAAWALWGLGALVVLVISVVLIFL